MSCFGCVSPPTGNALRDGLSADLRTLAAHHPDVDLNGCRVLVGAGPDPQLGAFRVLGRDGLPADGLQPHSAPLPDRPDPERGLAVTLPDSGTSLSVDLRALEGGSAGGDWRDFGVLLLDVHGPPGGVDLLLSITCSQRGAPAWSKPAHVHPGWNGLRIDLDEVRRELDLARLDTLTWRRLSGSGPATLHIAEVALANHTVWKVGRDSHSGGLYIFARGSRLFVGAHDRFELVFAGGVIVAWYADDQENLTAPTGFGPWPVRRFDGWPPRADASDLAQQWSAVARASASLGGSQRLIEASALRCVIEGGGTSSDRPELLQDEAAPERRRPRWRHVVYPDGRVYVCLMHAPAHAEPTGSRYGFSVVLDGRSGLDLSAPLPVNPNDEPASFVLLTRPGPVRLGLVWTCAAPTALRHQRILPPAHREPVLVLAGDMAARDCVQTAHLFRFWSENPDSAAEAEALAADYQRPATLRPTAGRVVLDAPGDLNQDGYNESEGCYEIALHRGLARFRIDPAGHPRENVVIRAHGTAGAGCAVYVEGETLPADCRDADGNLLLRLPGTIRTPRTFEVHTVPAAGP